MATRRRFKQAVPLKDRLQAEDLRRQAEQMSPGVKRNELMKKAREAEMAAHVDDWISSPGEQPLA
jgi:hypothetical protein